MDNGNLCITDSCATHLDFKNLQIKLFIYHLLLKISDHSSQKVVIMVIVVVVVVVMVVLVVIFLDLSIGS